MAKLNNKKQKKNLLAKKRFIGSVLGCFHLGFGVHAVQLILRFVGTGMQFTIYIGIGTNYNEYRSIITNSLLILTKNYLKEIDIRQLFFHLCCFCDEI